MGVLKKVLFLLIKAVVFACMWFVTFMVLALLAPVSEDGDITTPWSLAVLFLPFVAAGLFMHPKLWTKTRTKIDSMKIEIPQVKLPTAEPPKQNTSASETAAEPDAEPLPKLPFSKKKRIENVQALAHEASYEYDRALAATSPDLYVIHWNAAASALEELEKYRGTVPGSHFVGAPRKSTIVKDFQWKMRDSMERSVKVVIAELKGPHHNNKNGRFADYKSSFELYSEKYDAETMNFACDIMKVVAKAAGIHEFYFCGKHLIVLQDGLTHNTNTLDAVDSMGGHEFEYWCAKLLSDIGYKDVTVTQASGDQGVDVLAQKDGIKYAIQCKCYSSDLGNTPIQEVLAGKKFYHCHVGAVMTNRHFTKGAKDLAAETGILLWDRDWLSRALAETRPYFTRTIS